jgi:putative transposase
MNEKTKYNPALHHRKSIRLQGYDYSQAGLYFITMCCQDRACLFGEIVGADAGAEDFLPLHLPSIMKLNDAGKFANECWLQIPNHFPNAILHEYIIMPNHVHGIIELSPTVGAEYFLVGAEYFLPQQRNEFQKMIPRSIGSIVKGFKIGVTKWFRTNMKETFPFERQVWQRNYYEHIIRNEQSYNNISNYIINNPAKWNEDKFYKMQ